MAASLVLQEGVEPIPGYKLVRLLGRGGFGEVWEAVAPGDFRVALKFVRLGTTEAVVEVGSLNAIRNIRHPHLLDVQFATQVADCLVIATPLCDESLLDELRAYPAGLPLRRLLVYMDELSRAIDFLNEPTHRSVSGELVGVQHRDIKPHNIFLVGGSVRLADFGLAKILAATSARHSARAMSVHYVAPETFDGRVARQSDQYSLGITYCQLRTGKLPFNADSDVQIMYAHLHKAPDLSILPAAERAVLEKALAKRPEDRWPTCGAFVNDLILAAREDDHSGTAPALAVTKLLETEVPPPIPPTRIDDGSPSSVLPGVAIPRLRRAVPVALPILLVILMAVVIIPRLGRSPAPPPENPSRPSMAAPTPAPAESPKEIVLRPAPVEPTPVQVEPGKQITNTIGMKLVLIPAGEFLMGSPDSDRDASADEKPQHRVRITRPFYLGATEVTQGQYRAVVGQSPSYFKGSDDLPVEQVSWGDATAFCKKLSDLEKESLDGAVYVLPTEAEWEYACRAGRTTRYSFGDDAASLSEFAWYDGNAGGKTHPVGQKHPNAFNLHDMQGNVWEWCQDWYDANYYGRSPDADPPGSLQAAFRVDRGGSWNDVPLSARSPNRYWGAPENRLYDLGFRVARVQSSR